MVDIDEFGLHLNAANRKFGSSPVGLKIRKPDNYDRGTFKLTIILADETGDPAVAAGLPGSLARPRVWSEIQDLATTQLVLEQIIDNDINNMEDTFLHCGYIWI